jgi:RNA polymerase sigma factor (sigma-70 family)
MQEESQQRIRRAMAGLGERERHLLLLRSEGYSYREMATALDLNEASVGVLLARAKQAFLAHYRESADATR